MADKQSSLTPLTNAVTVLTESATEDGITFQPCEDTTCDCSSIALGLGLGLGIPLLLLILFNLCCLYRIRNINKHMTWRQLLSLLHTSPQKRSNATVDDSNLDKASSLGTNVYTENETSTRRGKTIDKNRNMNNGIYENCNNGSNADVPSIDVQLFEDGQSEVSVDARTPVKEPVATQQTGFSKEEQAFLDILGKQELSSAEVGTDGAEVGTDGAEPTSGSTEMEPPLAVQVSSTPPEQVSSTHEQVTNSNLHSTSASGESKVIEDTDAMTLSLQRAVLPDNRQDSFRNMSARALPAIPAKPIILPKPKINGDTENKDTPSPEIEEPTQTQCVSTSSSLTVDELCSESPDSHIYQSFDYGADPPKKHKGLSAEPESLSENIYQDVDSHASVTKPDQKQPKDSKENKSGTLTRMKRWLSGEGSSKRESLASQPGDASSYIDMSVKPKVVQNDDEDYAYAQSLFDSNNGKKGDAKSQDESKLKKKKRWPWDKSNKPEAAGRPQGSPVQKHYVNCSPETSKKNIKVFDGVNPAFVYREETYDVPETEPVYEEPDEKSKMADKQRIETKEPLAGSSFSSSNLVPEGIDSTIYENEEKVSSSPDDNATKPHETVYEDSTISVNPESMGYDVPAAVKAKASSFA